MALAICPGVAYPDYHAVHMWHFPAQLPYIIPTSLSSLVFFAGILVTMLVSGRWYSTMVVDDYTDDDAGLDILISLDAAPCLFTIG